MDAQARTSLALPAAAVPGSLCCVGNRVDSQTARIDGRLELIAKLDHMQSHAG